MHIEVGVIWTWRKVGMRSVPCLYRFIFSIAKRVRPTFSPITPAVCVLFVLSSHYLWTPHYRTLNALTHWGYSRNLTQISSSLQLQQSVIPNAVLALNSRKGSLQKMPSAFIPVYKKLANSSGRAILLRSSLETLLALSHVASQRDRYLHVK